MTSRLAAVAHSTRVWIMGEESTGSASDAAFTWLDGVVSNTGDPNEDAGVWMLTHESLRRELASACLGENYADVGSELDVTTLDDWQELARCAVLQLRQRLPTTMHVEGVGGLVGLTQFAVPVSLDRVEVVFNDEGLESGAYNFPPGTRVGFALVAVHAANIGWTIGGIEPDWLMPEG